MYSRLSLWVETEAPWLGKCLFGSAHGQRLTSFFYGLTANASFTANYLEKAGKGRRKLAEQCGEPSKISLLENLISFARPMSVSADEYCFAQPCGGSRWVSDIVSCESDACKGDREFGRTDIQGPSNQGIQQTSAECDHRQGYESIHCPCKWALCTSGSPPCEGNPCDPANPFHSCSAGLKCTSGGCCADYTCPSGEVKCQGFPLDCQSNDPQGGCIDGCCIPITCFSDSQCSTPQYRCVEQRCVKQLTCEMDCYRLDPKSYEYPDPCLYTESLPCKPGWQLDNATGCCLSGGSPILVDVEGDGFLLTSGDDGVLFDLRGSGSKVKWAWTVAGSDDAWLALDRNGNNVIDSGLELFGNATAQPDKPGERHGFTALAVFDRPAEGGNDDGWIDRKDTVFPRLLLWRDVNHNGISESGELISLPQAGITAISLDYKESRWTDAYGNQFKYRAKVVSTRDGKGKDKWAYDVFLVAVSPSGVNTPSQTSRQR